MFCPDNQLAKAELQANSEQRAKVKLSRHHVIARLLSKCLAAALEVVDLHLCEDMRSG